MRDVSVIIVTWNSAPYIGPCLESIQTHGAAHCLEIIVADNGSVDDTCALALAQAPDIVLLRMGANLGFPRANNLAAERARGDYLFFLNPDTHLDNDAIGILRERLASDPSLGIAGPGIMSESGESIAVDARCFPSLRGTAFRYFGLRSLFPHHPLFGGEYLHPARRQSPQPVECVTGAALLMEAAFFRALGGFDDSLPMYFEDIELCGKVRAAGRACGFVPGARVTHYGGKSTARSPIAQFLHALEDGQAPWMYFRKYRSPARATGFTVILAAGNLFRLGLYALAAPLLLAPRYRAILSGRALDALTLLRWCFSDKAACGAKALSLFDREPGEAFAEGLPEGSHER